MAGEQDKSPKRLDGWKAISDYINRDTRTAIRWNKERGMPVHRVPGSSGHGGIFAFPEELDAWLRSESRLPLEPIAEEAPQRTSHAIYWAIPVFCAALLLAAAAMYRPLRPKPIAAARFGNNKLSTFDENGRLAWEHVFPDPVQVIKPERGNQVRNRLVDPLVVDLTGDGRREILLVVPHTPDPNRYSAREELACFSPEGRLLWRYEPQITLSFGGQKYEPPWKFLDLQVPPGSGRRDIWVSVGHVPWWPSFVVKLDVNGRPQIRFFNSGLIYSLTFIENQAGAYLLAGGVANEYDAAMLAVLDTNGPPALSPQDSLAFTCDNCAANSRPIRYFVFPRSEVNAASGASYNFVFRVSLTGSVLRALSLEIETTEATPVYHYDLSHSFELISTSVSDFYWQQHQRLEQTGRIKHAARDCPERTEPRKVRMWTPEAGWAEVRVRPGPFGRY